MKWMAMRVRASTSSGRVIVRLRELECGHQGALGARRVGPGVERTREVEPGTEGQSGPARLGHVLERGGEVGVAMLLLAGRFGQQRLGLP